MKIDFIPLSIRTYLIEIAERLWTGHASVMVGADIGNSINLPDAQKRLPNVTKNSQIKTVFDKNSN